MSQNDLGKLYHSIPTKVKTTSFKLLAPSSKLQAPSRDYHADISDSTLSE